MTQALWNPTWFWPLLTVRWLLHCQQSQMDETHSGRLAHCAPGWGQFCPPHLVRDTDKLEPSEAQGMGQETSQFRICRRFRRRSCKVSNIWGDVEGNQVIFALLWGHYYNQWVEVKLQRDLILYIVWQNITKIAWQWSRLVIKWRQQEAGFDDFTVLGGWAPQCHAHPSKGNGFSHGLSCVVDHLQRQPLTLHSICVQACYSGCKRWGPFLLPLNLGSPWFVWIN